jgi:DNA-binding NarL/FixJ family response regulator
MAQGKSNKAIAEALSIGVGAVERHINTIFMELGLARETSLNRRVSAVLFFLRDGDALD